MKLYIDDRDNGYLYEMANFDRNSIKQPFDLWVDEAGKDRKVEHNLPRFKPKNNGIELEIVIRPDGKVINKSSKQDTKAFGHATEAMKFVEKFKKPLLMHFYKEIDTTKLGTIFFLVARKKYTVDDAIEFVTDDDV